MQPKQDMLMLEKDDKALKCFNFYKNEKYILNKENIEKNHRDFVRKNLNTRSHAKIICQHIFFKMDFL